MIPTYFVGVTDEIEFEKSFQEEAMLQDGDLSVNTKL